MNIAFITCYKQPDYIRGFMLRKTAATLPDVEVFTVKNTRTGLLRYPEVFIKLLAVRLKHHPDSYVLTFRGQEMLPLVTVATWPKPLIFDELVNPLGWTYEPGREKKLLTRLRAPLTWLYRLMLKPCRYILADTDTHAAYSASLSHLPIERYVTLPVSADEAMFKPSTAKHGDVFRVFYIGNMVPLHGLQHVLEATVLLKDLPIEFRIIGGKPEVQAAIRQAKEQGAHILYEPWVPFDAIPTEIATADLCLAGPFGDTAQARVVITGKAYQFLACGAPTLIGQNKASDLFKSRVNCLTTPLGDSATLADNIRWAYEHQPELSAIGKNGHELYVRELSEKVLATKLQALFQRLT